MPCADLTTLSNVKAWLPDMASVTTSDALISRLISAASQAVAVYTGRADFAVTTYQETYDGTGSGALMLRQWPVVDVQSVGFSDGSTAQEFTLEPPAAGCGPQRLSLSDGTYPSGPGAVSVTYDAGWPATPLDVEQAVIEIVGERFRARERIGLSSKSLGGQETTAFSGKAFNDTVAALLAPYRRVSPW